MELYQTRSVLGYTEIGWSIRQCARKLRARTWVPIEGTVEGYELLVSGRNGWLVIFYSYKFHDEQFSGELRRWFLFRQFDVEDRVASLTERFPRGISITVRVNPRDPTESAHLRSNGTDAVR